MTLRDKTFVFPFAALVLCAALGRATFAQAPAAAVPANPRLDDWTVIGPGGGGTMQHPAISPHDKNLVLVACDMTGAYISENGGESWRMFNLGSVVSSFAFDPSRPDVIYAATSALWKSVDRGRTWKMVFPDPARTREIGAGDHADYALQTDDPLYPPLGERMAIQGISVRRSGEVVVALSGNGEFRGSSRPAVLVSSPDGERGWARLRELPSERILAMAVSPDDRLAIVSSHHVWREHGSGWTEASLSPDTLHAASLGFAEGGTAVVYAVVGDANAESASRVMTWRDDKPSWTDVTNGLMAGTSAADGARLTTIAVFPAAPARAYVGLEHVRVGGGDVFNGIAETRDGGATWRVVNREGRTPSPTMKGSWVEERAGSPSRDVWFDSPRDLAVSPTDGGVVYATDLFRTYRTTDGGAHWEQVHSRNMGPRQWTTRGLDVTTTYGVHVSPHDPKRIFISYTDIGLFRSEDGGRSWTISSDGVPYEWRNTAYWVVFDPADPNLMWGAFSGTHDLPRPKMWRARNPDTFKGGVGVSHDAGRTWTPLTTLPQGAVTHLLLDPRSPAGRRTLYATVFGRGVFKTTDGGQTWTAMNTGLRGAQPFAWRLVSDGGSRLFLVVARRSENGRIGDDGDGALYVSTDGAAHWTSVPLPSGTNGPTGLLVDPSNPHRLYLSAWGVAHQDGDTGGGIFASDDDGATWTPIFTRAQHVYDVTIDPRDSTLYACGFDQGAWRSRDKGATWQRLGGYTFKWGHRVVPDPTDPAKVYITTFGGSVWHGPAAGDPDAVGDVIVPARQGS